MAAEPGVKLTAAEEEAAAKSDRVLRHVVLLKFKDSVPPDQVEQLEKAFYGLAGKVDSILELEGGRLVYDSGAAAARPPDGDSDDSSIFELMPDGLPLDDTAKQPTRSKRAGPAP